MSQFTVLDLGQLLGIKPKKAINYLQVELGEKVDKDQLLARKKGLLGKAKEVFSPVQGVLERLEEETGCLFIKKKEKQKSKKAGSKSAKRVKGVFALGHCRGKMFFLGSGIKLKDLKAKKLKDKVVALGRLDSKGVIFKAAALGVKGIVVGQMKNSLLADISSLGEKLDLNLLVLSEEEEKKEKFLKKNDKKKVILSGKKKSLIIDK